MFQLRIEMTLSYLRSVLFMSPEGQDERGESVCLLSFPFVYQAGRGVSWCLTEVQFEFIIWFPLHQAQEL